MKLPLWKKLVYSAAALLIPLALLELVLHCFSWESPGEPEDPFLGLVGDSRLFEKDSGQGLYRIRDSRLGFFRPAEFLIEKPADGFRVFVIGGSTVQGRPWETETAFSSWLELAIQSCEPEKTVEVINCGGVSYASYRLRPIVNEVLGYSPDLIVLCTGHNEYLENRTYHFEKSLPGPLVSGHRLLSSLKSYQWMRSRVFRMRHGESVRDELGETVLTRLDYRNGLDRFSEQTLQREAVREHFRYNIRGMVRAVQKSDVPMAILAPPSCQRTFPFKPTVDWKPESTSEFGKSSLKELKEAMKSGKGRADMYYFTALFEQEQQQYLQARANYDAAIDTDLCPLRMTSTLRQILAEVASEEGASRREGGLLYIDLQQKCAGISANRIIDRTLLVDHVHPSVGTHKRIADWLLQRLQEESIVARPEGWQARFQKAADEHQATLDFSYYQRGKDRLESVLKWSRGQALHPLEDSDPR